MTAGFFSLALVLTASASGEGGVRHSLVPAGKWDALFEHLQSVSSFSAQFSEARYQAFRGTAQRFSGVLRFHADHGVAFHYLQRRERLFLIRDNTLFDATGGTPENVHLPGDARNLIIAVSRLVQWDQKWISETFRLSGEYRNTEWRLELDPVSNDLDDVLMNIVMHGSDTRIQKIIIHQTPNRRVEFSIEDIELHPGWSPRELDRFFPPHS